MSPPTTRPFRVAILTGHGDERELRHLVRQVAAVPAVAIAGVIRAPSTPPRSLRLRRYWKRHGTAAVAFNLAYHTARAAGRIPRAAIDRLLDSLHPPRPRPDLAALLRDRSIAEVRLRSLREPDARDALRALDAD